MKKHEDKLSEENRLVLFTGLCIVAIVLIVFIAFAAVRPSVTSHSPTVSEGISTGDGALVGQAFQRAIPYGGGGSPTAEVAPFSNYCSDTDNGKMYKKYGRVTGFINNQRVSHADECVDDQVVREWYCKNQGSYRIPDDEYASCPGVYGEGAFCAKGRCVVNYGR